MTDLLHKSEISKSRTAFVSLVNDTATSNAINNTSLKKIAIHSNNTSLSQEQMYELFKQNTGKDIIVLGHVEDGNFVTRNASGAIVSSISVNYLRGLAAKHDNLLIELGCNTAGSASNARAPAASIATRFNTVDAANRLASALESSSDLSEFFQALASNTLQVVVDHAAIENRIQYHAAYYETVDRAFSKVADVNVTTRSSGIFSSMMRWFR